MKNKVLLIAFLLGLVLVVVAYFGPDQIRERWIGDATGPESTDTPTGKNYVLWFSIDGINPPDLDLSDTPFWDRLRSVGSYSLEHRVVFPSVTFASHVSQATGVKVADHGIPANRFYDRATGRVHSYPGAAGLLEAEPIWNTVQRQGLRVAVKDWPLSHQQQGPDATSYHGERYERGLTDRERLWQVMDLWREDPDPASLRLLMGYAVGPDSPGHAHGPGAEPVREALERVDRLLGELLEEAVTFFEEFRKPGDRLIFIVTSDHGMSPVHTLVHPGLLTGLEDVDEVVAVHSANLVHFTFLDEDRSEEHIQSALQQLEEYSFARGYRRAELPAHWQYQHPDRVGDLVVVLETGYTFSRRPREVTAQAARHGGPVGMHGYDPREDPAMDTVAFFYRYPEPPSGGADLGKIHSLQLHPTVARLLEVEPAVGAEAEPLILFSP